MRKRSSEWILKRLAGLFFCIIGGKGFEDGIKLGIIFFSASSLGCGGAPAVSGRRRLMHARW